MRRFSIIFSVIFHVMIIIIAIKGLPFFKTREFIIPKAIVIDYIEVAKVTETKKVKIKPAKKVKKQRPKAAAKNISKHAKKVKPKKKLIKKVKKEKKSIADNAVVRDENALPNKTKKTIVKEVRDKDFSSVLKNLVAQEDTVKKDKPAQNAPLGEKMTISEQDALRSQLERCWNVPFGAKDVEDIIVDISIKVNPDRTLREARIVNKSRYNSNSFFRAVADSAFRAVNSPLCSPFNLPPDKYDLWKNMVVTFNPKDMF